MAGPHVHVPFHKVQAYLPFIREHRLDLEVFFSAASLDSVKVENLNAFKASLDYSPSLSMHAPFMDLSPGAVDTKVMQVTLERFNQVMDCAEVLKPKVVVFHSGYEKWKYALKIEPWLSRSLETWKPLEERARRLDTIIGVENIFEDEPSSIRILMEAMASPAFGVCFDTGHCNLFTSVPLADWLSQLKPHIVELHLHDNDGNADAHLPIGDGSFDFQALFSALDDERLLCTIEAHSPERVLTSVERLKKFLKRKPE